MARRRRARGFSGTPEQHAAVAAQFVRMFRSRMKEARRYLDNGNCADALHAFRGAAGDAGAYATNRVVAAGRVRAGMMTSRRMTAELTALEDKIQWCS